MIVRAKFKVVEIKSTHQQHKKDPAGDWNQANLETVEMRTIVLQPVSGDSPENLKFWDATPSGRIELGTINPEAWQAFVLSQNYYVHFVLADG